MRIAEIYSSIQGEGFLTGTPSVFIRASGCNLRCWFCDTPYASWHPEGKDLPVEAIVAQSESLGGQHVVLTGGEPMLFADLVPLAESLHALGRHVTIETAGTRYLPVTCDLMSISPKLPNSAPEQDPHWLRVHEQRRCVPDVIRRLAAEYCCQFKFVVDSLRDCLEVERYLAEFPEIDRTRAMLMPQGIDRSSLEEKARWLKPYCDEHGLGFCPRRHIEWFGAKRGT